MTINSATTIPLNGCPRIHLIQVYLGRLPSYYPLFLSSCRFSPDVQFSIVSDQPAPPAIPPNVRWVQTALTELRERLGEAVGVEVALHNGYKLCDYKPTFGAAFSDLIEGADYWGYVDPDVIVGDVAGALAPALAARPDVLATKDVFWLTGALCLYRNTEVVNSLFHRAPSVPTLYQNSTCVRFAEVCGRWTTPPGSPEVLSGAGHCVSMTDVVVEAAAKGDISFSSVRKISEPKTVGDGGNPFVIRVRNGTMSDGKGSLALCHLVFAKSDPWYLVPSWDQVPDSFDITERGIYAVGDAAGWLLSEPRRLLMGAFKSAHHVAARGLSGVRRRVTPVER